MSSFRSATSSVALRSSAVLLALALLTSGCSSDEPTPPAERPAEPPKPAAQKIVDGVVRPKSVPQPAARPKAKPRPTYAPEIEAKLTEIAALQEDAPDTPMKLDTYLSDESPAVRESATGLLEDVGGSLAITRLEKVLTEDSDHTVRLRAVESLEYIGGPKAEAVIAKGLTDEDPRVRGEATAVLAYLESTEQLPAIQAARATETEAELQQAMDAAIEEISDSIDTPADTTAPENPAPADGNS